MFIWFELNQNIIHYIDIAQRYIQCVIFCHRVLSEKYIPIYIAFSTDLPKFIKAHWRSNLNLTFPTICDCKTLCSRSVPTLFDHNLTIPILETGLSKRHSPYKNFREHCCDVYWGHKLRSKYWTGWPKLNYIIIWSCQ